MRLTHRSKKQLKERIVSDPSRLKEKEEQHIWRRLGVVLVPAFVSITLFFYFINEESGYKPGFHVSEEVELKNGRDMLRQENNFDRAPGILAPLSTTDRPSQETENLEVVANTEERAKSLNDTPAERRFP